MSRDGFHERVPLRHRFPRVLQHLQPLLASDTDEIGADRRATHQLVRADSVEGKKIRWSKSTIELNHRSGLFFDLVAHSPVVIDHFHYEADVLDIFRGHVEHQDLVVHREQSVLLHRGLLLFDPSVLAQQVHFHVRIYEYVFLDIFLFVLSRDDGMDISKDRAVCIYTSFSLTSGK